MTNPAKKPHCKDVSHLAVTLGNETPSTKLVTATFDPQFACANTPYNNWGVVLSNKKDKLNGLHLLPESVAWLPGQLRTHALAATGKQTVIISHTVNKVFSKFVALTPGAAIVLADAIDTAAKAAQ